ncbi:MAG: AmmeMemoRadiSam system protein B [Treponema sp.]|jgi:AmmeMemoRadiSam system protein B|nr:AmmeMemoRadiSam system protein B [Treponema sp.]
MKIRESSLPAGWYPRNLDEISRFLSEWGRSSARAALAPHAGWRYSGKIAARAVSSLDRNVETLAVIGGHLPAGCPPLFALEDSVSTPLGGMSINAGLRAALRAEIGGREDRYPDNTVEVLLPMARFFFPEASLLWLRLPAELSSFDAGKAIASAAAKLGCGVAVLASSDLTHYGPNYGFTPKGTGAEALHWVREVNDRCFINAVESGDPAAVLERAETDSSSCSAGAVLGAMGFAAAEKLGSARLLGYGTSADTETAEGPEVPDSFVGYAAMAYDGYNHSQ